MSTGTLICPMRGSYRAVIVLLAALGLAGIVFGALELAGALDVPAPRRWVEGAAALTFGVVAIPIALSALRVARLELSPHELRYLKLGLPCSLGVLRLDALRRHGTAVERRKGRTRTILLLETEDGRRVDVQLSMYARGRELAAALSERTGLAPAATSVTFVGSRFADAD